MGLDKFVKDFSGLTQEYKFYNGEVTLRYEPDNHIYYLLTEDNRFIPQAGVTSICHIIDKSNALIPWACKMMAEKLLRTTSRVTTPAFDVIPQMEYSAYEKLVLEAKSAHREKLEEAADVGHIAHDWIENYIKKELGLPCNDTSLFPADEKATSCCVAALDWMKKHNVRWVHTEKKIYSRTHQYAGTADGMALVDSCDDPLCCPNAYKDRKAVIDWKSSNYLYVEYTFQVAAYMQALEEEFGEEFGERWIIRLGKTDGEFEAWHLEGREPYEQDLKAFLDALSLTRSVDAVEERMKIRKNFLKEVAKQKKAAEKEASLAVACKNSSKYKGTRKPTCNGGNPCKTCLEIYEKAQATKAEK